MSSTITCPQTDLITNMVKGERETRQQATQWLLVVVNPYVAAGLSLAYMK